ncbi:MAG: PaaI family thioesterase [Acidobacteriaceae bacterium]|nr:PaaI family thioesterase [Acidobacteriaceae bacterium]
MNQSNDRVAIFQRRMQVTREEFPAPIGKLLGLTLMTQERGRATIERAVRNPMGMLHGGVLCDIADAAMGAAYHTTLAEGETFTSLGLKINFLRPVREANLRAEARVVRVGKVVGFVECNILDEQEGLVACASSTCMTLRGQHARGREVTSGVASNESR